MLPVSGGVMRRTKMTIVNFPPLLECPACGQRLRLATKSEIASDLCDSRFKQVAEAAAQGSREWEPPVNWPEWKKDISPPASWLFRCDGCGNRTLWSSESE